MLTSPRIAQTEIEIQVVLQRWTRPSGPMCHWTFPWRASSLVLLEQFLPEHSESLAHTCRMGSTVCLCRDFLCRLIVDNSVCTALTKRGPEPGIFQIISEYEQRKQQRSCSLAVA